MAVPQGQSALVDGRRCRILAVINHFHREWFCLVADVSFSGSRVACELDRIAELRSYPCLVGRDNGSGLISNAC